MERSSGRARKASQKVVESREVFLDEVAVISKRKIKSTHKDQQTTSDAPLPKQPRNVVYEIPVLPPVSFPVDQFIPCSVALSLLDKAKQISVSVDQLTCTGASGGFRMIRATHGVHLGPYYWECEILPSPSSSSSSSSSPSTDLQPHVRVGWSTRFGIMTYTYTYIIYIHDYIYTCLYLHTYINTSIHQYINIYMHACYFSNHPLCTTGQLNGPVGYDKHSYGYRDVGGEAEVRLHLTLSSYLVMFYLIGDCLIVCAIS